MDRRSFIWPTSGSGVAFAEALRHASNAAANANNGSPSQIVDKYLDWGVEQNRLLRGRISPTDLGHFVTTPRYWATVSSPEPSPATVRAITAELSHQAQALEAAADAVRRAAEAWKPQNEEMSAMVVVDTSFWMEHHGSLTSIDWYDVIRNTDGPGQLVHGAELRIVVPILVVDELDGLTHKGQTRPKAAGVTKYLYKLLAEAGSKPVPTYPERDRGGVFVQLVLDPPGHSRSPISDEEIIDRGVALRDFVGMSPHRSFFLTYDTGAAFRAEHAGLMPRLIARF